MEMGRGIATYTVIGALVAVAILLIYSSTFQFTGQVVQVVLNQDTCADFDLGTYGNGNVLCDVNTSTVVLDVNQTNGTYTSKIYDALEEATWNNLTWTGQGDLAFEVLNCSSADCANGSFASADLNNLNLTAQYFQYRVSFLKDPNLTVSLENVSIDYSVPEPAPENVTVSVSEPAGEKNSVSGIPITFTATGENITCEYSVHDTDNNIIINNTVLAGCGDFSFDVDADGSYVFTIYVNNSLESVSDISGFSVVTPVASGTEDGEETVVEEELEPVPIESPKPRKITKLTGIDIQNISLASGSSRGATWTVTNTGTEPISTCKLKPLGDYASWMPVSDATTNLNPGEGKNFTLDIAIPEDSGEGSYLLSISLECHETFVAKDFSVEVFEKKLDFRLIDVQRTRDDRVRVLYSLEELAGDDQDIEFVFSLVDANDVEVGKVEENKSVDADSFDEFRTDININESLLPINETTNETLESELILNVNFNSQIYSSSVQEKVMIGAPVGFAIFGGIGAGNAVALLVVVLALATVLFIARRMRRSGKTLGSLFKREQ